jgi:hypothetical protein
MVKDSPESRINVICMEKEIEERKCDPPPPDTTEEAGEGRHIINGWALVGVSRRRFWDGCVGRTCGVGSVRTICTIDADTALAFLPGPLYWIQHQTDDKIAKEAREMEMKGFLFLFRKLFLHSCFILIHSRVIIVAIAGLDVCNRAHKVSF